VDDDAEFVAAMLKPAVGPHRVLYYMEKKGSSRTFAGVTPPSEEWAAALKADGYRILRVTFTMPLGWDSANAVTTIMTHDQLEDVTNDPPDTA
jgi:hypothetical protein